MKINIDIDVDKIIEKRTGGINNVGMVLATTMERVMQPYVPMSEGASAHMVNRVQIISKNDEQAEIVYPGPYAHYVYIGEVYGPNFMTKKGWRSYAGKSKTPTGRQMEYTGAPERDKEWDKRAWQARSREVLEALTKRMGGTAK